jgi:hypothetical protein
MGLFKSEDPEQRAARETTKRREREEQASRQEAESFKSSPLGQAVSAKVAGDGFFQVELEHSRISRNFMEFGMDYDAHGVSQKKHPTRADLLSEIEKVGWRLEHVNHVWVQKGAISRDKFLSSGQEVGVTGEVIGIYLFRATDAQVPAEMVARLPKG